MSVKLISFISLWFQAARALHVYQPYRVVGSSREIMLRCYYQTTGQPDELRLTLYRGMYGKQEMCASSFNTSQSHFETQGEVRCRGQIQPGHVDLHISGLVGQNTDLYQCAFEVLYPPPYLFGIGNGTLLYIPEDLDCPAPAEKLQANTEGISEGASVLPWMVFALIIVIVVIFTTAVSYKVFTMKYRRREFMGIRPVPPKKVDCKMGYDNFL